MEPRNLFTFLLAASAIASIVGEGKLLSVTQVFRHGERTPVLFFPTDTYKNSSYWDGLGPGQLTNYGKKQLLDLGQYFRARYNNFLSTNYSEDEIYVRTVISERNYQSAESFLSGLYPNNDGDIPIHYSSIAVMGGLKECLRYDLLYLDMEENNEYFKSINKENEETYNYLKENSGSPVYGLTTAHMIWDTLYIESRHKYTLPEWTASVFPEKLTNLTDVYALSLCYTEEQQKLVAGAFLHTLIEHFESILSDPSKTPKVQLYSVHDDNIACLLNTFQSFTPHNPDFASSLFFELKQGDEGNFINAYYREGGEAAPITLRGCDFDCKLEDLKEVFKNLVLTELQWVIKCYTPL